MRAASLERRARLAQRVYQPWYLIDITLDQQYHLTNGPTVTLDGVTYERAPLGGVSEDDSGIKLLVRNTDYQHTMAAARGDYLRQHVAVAIAGSPQVLYVDQDGTPYADQDGAAYIVQEGVESIALLSGGITSIPEYDDWLTIVVERDVGRTFPARRIVPPFANHTRPEGTLIPVNNGVYRITTRNGGA